MESEAARRSHPPSWNREEEREREEEPFSKNQKEEEEEEEEKGSSSFLSFLCARRRLNPKTTEVAENAGSKTEKYFSHNFVALFLNVFQVV